MMAISDRDWFAAFQLASMGQWTPDHFPARDKEGNLFAPGTVQHTAAQQMARAKWAYSQADAMLAARKDKAS